MTGDDQGRWVSAHLFYHGPLDPMIVELVGPLTAELMAEGLTSGSFFLRYWDGGRHLRLRYRTPPGQITAVRQRILVRASRFFTDRPATGTIDPDEYAATAARLARAEGMTRFTRRPYPTSSVGFIAYRREHHRYGYGASMAAVERHFVESSEVALQVLAGEPSADQRATAGLCMLLVAAFAAEPDPARLHTRLRRSALATGPPAAGADGDDQQVRIAHELAIRMRTLVVRVARLPPGGTLAAWTRSAVTLATSLSAIGSGRRFPILDLCAHLMCNRLGIAPEEERRLRLLGISAIARLTRGSRQTARSGPTMR